MKRRFFCTILFLFFATAANSLSLTDLTVSLSDMFVPFVNTAEGVTSFRSLQIPIGGRAESLGGAFTGLADDSSYLNFNPAASSVLKTTQFALYHNSWIADSNLETVVFTSRTGDFGLGAAVSCFYIPFTEYNALGLKVNSGYYTETTAALNFSYNFLAGYNFKGIAVGGNLKASFRGVPDYTDEDTNEIIAGSGFAQSAFAIMADAGIMMRFNLAKFYASREPNFKIGISAQNFGVSFTGLSEKLTLDDPLPTSVAIGISYKFIKPVTFTLDFKQPLNLADLSEYQIFSIGSGVEVRLTNFLAFLAGFQFKGANPKISLGAEFELAKIMMNICYTLDLTSSVAPVNRISLSAKIQLGDKGRGEIEKKIDTLYNLGVYYFSLGEYAEAIEVWEEVLKLNKRFDPAILGIKSANHMLELFQKIHENMFLDTEI